MATTAAIAELAGTRRAVVRSERFMEWQRELTSSRAGYGGRKRQEENNDNPETKKFRKSDDEEDATTRPMSASEEGDERGDTQSAAGNAEAGPESTQQQAPQRKRLKKSKPELGSSKDSGEADAGARVRRNGKQQAGGPQAQATRRTQRRTSRPSYSPPRKEDTNFRILTRTRGNVSPPPGPASKETKRSKRVAQRLANEEPPPPPLKLPKLHLALTRKEIQEDWMKITGHKYTGKPKKSTLIQRGFGLCTSLTCPSSIRYLNDPQCEFSFMAFA